MGLDCMRPEQNCSEEAKDDPRTCVMVRRCLFRKARRFETEHKQTRAGAISLLDDGPCASKKRKKEAEKSHRKERIYVTCINASLSPVQNRPEPYQNNPCTRVGLGRPASMSRPARIRKHRAVGDNVILSFFDHAWKSALAAGPVKLNPKNVRDH